MKHHISLDRFLGADGAPVPSAEDEFPPEDRLFPVCTWAAATISLDEHMAGSGVDLGLLHNCRGVEGVPRCAGGQEHLDLGS